MTDKELDLLAKLIEANGKAIEALTIVAESNYLIAQALSPMPMMGVVMDDEPGPTIQ
jgi:hypothetical protein